MSNKNLLLQIEDKGREEGLEEGREEGRDERDKEIITNLRELNYSNEDICDILKISLAELIKY